MKLNRMLYMSYFIIVVWLWLLYQSFKEGYVVGIWTYRVMIVLLIINVLKMMCDIKIIRMSKYIIDTQIIKDKKFEKSLNLPEEWDK